MQAGNSAGRAPPDAFFRGVGHKVGSGTESAHGSSHSGDGVHPTGTPVRAPPPKRHPKSAGATSQFSTPERTNIMSPGSMSDSFNDEDSFDRMHHQHSDTAQAPQRYQDASDAVGLDESDHGSESFVDEDDGPAGPLPGEDNGIGMGSLGDGVDKQPSVVLQGSMADMVDEGDSDDEGDDSHFGIEFPGPTETVSHGQENPHLHSLPKSSLSGTSAGSRGGGLGLGLHAASNPSMSGKVPQPGMQGAGGISEPSEPAILSHTRVANSFDDEDDDDYEDYDEDDFEDDANDSKSGTNGLQEHGASTPPGRDGAKEHEQDSPVNSPASSPGHRTGDGARIRSTAASSPASSDTDSLDDVDDVLQLAAAGKEDEDRQEDKKRAQSEIIQAVRPADPDEVGLWEHDDVAAWLREFPSLQDLAHYAATPEMTGELLMSLTDDTMRDLLGVDDDWDRQRILLARDVLIGKVAKEPHPKRGQL